mgnify:CR=1 FL=1
MTARTTPAARTDPFALAAAVVLLIALPALPGFIATGAPAALLHVPGESLLILLVLALVPWRTLRIVLAATFGALIVLALVLGGIDRGYRAVLGTRFDPLDWPQLGSAVGVAADAIGPLAVADAAVEEIIRDLFTGAAATAATTATTTAESVVTGPPAAREAVR